MEYAMEKVSQNIRITPEKIVKMLQMEGVILSEEEATQLWVFLKKIARITVTKYLERNGS